jgi:hypothetical protein
VCRDEYNCPGHVYLSLYKFVWKKSKAIKLYIEADNPLTTLHWFSDYCERQHFFCFWQLPLKKTLDLSRCKPMTFHFIIFHLTQILQTKFTNSFLPSPRRYSSGWALVSWIISPHFSLFCICSDNEASNGRMKKWEECGWKRSWPTYFSWFSVHSIHPRLIIWFLNNLVFTVWGC